MTYRRMLEENGKKLKFSGDLYSLVAKLPLHALEDIVLAAKNINWHPLYDEDSNSYDPDDININNIPSIMLRNQNTILVELETYPAKYPAFWQYATPKDDGTSMDFIKSLVARLSRSNKFERLSPIKYSRRPAMRGSQIMKLTTIAFDVKSWRAQNRVRISVQKIADDKYRTVVQAANKYGASKIGEKVLKPDEIVGFIEWTIDQKMVENGH